MTEQIDDRVILRAELCKRLDVCGETMRRWIKAKRLPPPDVAVTRRTTGWRLSTLAAAGIKLT